MKLLFACSEASPFAKTGGLGDVMGALPHALSKIRGNEVCVILPFYHSIKYNPAFPAEYVCHFSMPLAWRNQYVGIFKAVVPGTGKNHRRALTYYFVDNEYYFGRDGYGYEDDGERFAFFSKAVLESLQYIDFMPDVIHCNDWQTAFLPLFLKAFFLQNRQYSHLKTVLTIHNVEYQGKADPSFLPEVLGVDAYWRGAATHDGLVNALKCGIVLSDRLTTVSETYAYELHHDYFAHGLAGIIKENAYKMTGIVNGIDTAYYDPATDPCLPLPFHAEDLQGKKENKRILQEQTGLWVTDEMPLVIMISRLVPHKGLDLVEAVGDALAQCGIQLAVLGTGYRKYEDVFRTLAYRYPGRVSAHICFDETLSRLLYGAADFLLMPSKSEPCGLSQLIAMRYGTIPIVRETGGLVDTVPPINPETGEGRGITFKLFNAHDMLSAVERAAEIYRNRPLFEAIQKSNMRLGTDWKKSAEKYMEVYNSL
ncbi:MAG: glycogen synthase [Ruminococcaceae bacterium]|nr:glycogen synthase [Oscillospiraceae bacterium]